MFELSQAKHGGWHESILYSFNLTDGFLGVGRLTMDKNGNLFGVTRAGGDFQQGVVFKLSPSGSGWTEQVIHSFSTQEDDGRVPVAGVTLDDAGKVYGTPLKAGPPDGARCFGFHLRRTVLGRKLYSTTSPTGWMARNPLRS